MFLISYVFLKLITKMKCILTKACSELFHYKVIKQNSSNTSKNEMSKTSGKDFGNMLAHVLVKRGSYTFVLLFSCNVMTIWKI